ncbi:8d6a7a79-fc8b-4700-bc15-8a7dd6c27514-CDS [Sclerotinia trifoliorum]|uniref:8d6a7a79-fc8b-4700-bc15-8a7dd6c27514-CDS n=1 Tax=Sclerotinia trifoliorum TaxID=28548 RepID=A0A8H2VP27_9HELO|nr:8d6a7a79-fc8b-4700-bc15-8a7dd6c27514-CDS [Sclerotinia trifoliorum]
MKDVNTSTMPTFTPCFRSTQNLSPRLNFGSLHLHIRLSRDLQRKTATAFGLNFKDWTMVTEVLHVRGRFNIDIGSKSDHRLACIYKEEFLVHKELLCRNGS